MTPRQIAACMRDLAEHGWVVLQRRDHLDELVAVLQRLNVQHTIAALGSGYMVRCAMEGDIHSESAKGGYIA